ncbi:MAG: hypothetical protein HYY55_03645 [Candidatus Niyogibacteria bacterium]|nr:MAG: hypothetical protein HYY55_03645 [Candidatus Niyogibacteria bacterium]
MAVGGGMRQESLNEICFTNFLHLALIRLLLEEARNTPLNRKITRARIVVDSRDSVFHPLFYALQEMFGCYLPPLLQLDFYRGAGYPYSQELSKALSDIHVQESIIYASLYNNTFMVHARKDTRRFCNKELKKLFSDNPKARQAFDRLIQALKSLVIRIEEWPGVPSE